MKNQRELRRAPLQVGRSDTESFILCKNDGFECGDKVSETWGDSQAVRHADGNESSDHIGEFSESAAKKKDEGNFEPGEGDGEGEDEEQDEEEALNAWAKTIEEKFCIFSGTCCLSLFQYSNIFFSWFEGTTVEQEG